MLRCRRTRNCATVTGVRPPPRARCLARTARYWLAVVLVMRLHPAPPACFNFLLLALTSRFEFPPWQRSRSAPWAWRCTSAARTRCTQQTLATRASCGLMPCAQPAGGGGWGGGGGSRADLRLCVGARVTTRAPSMLHCYVGCDCRIRPRCFTKP